MHDDSGPVGHVDVWIRCQSQQVYKVVDVIITVKPPTTVFVFHVYFELHAYGLHA